jgi:hypothetical protein
MGIRVQKILGWGLTDVNNADDDWSAQEDERFNSEVLEEYFRQGDNPLEFLSWLENNIDECKEVMKKVDGNEHVHLTDITFLLNKKVDGKWDTSKMNHLCTYDAEFGQSSVMVFCPINAGKEWHRYDDLIDYYEAGRCCGEATVNLLDSCGIWPYEGMYHIPNSPNYGKEEYPNDMLGGEYNRLIGAFSEKMGPMVEGEELEYYKKYYRPCISPCLILHLYWLGIFNDFYKTIHELRPMIYTYWS